MDFEISQEAESEPESEVVHGGSAKSVKAAQVQATAWTFHREWDFRIPGQEDVRSIAEFILENDVRKRMHHAAPREESRLKCQRRVPLCLL